MEDTTTTTERPERRLGLGRILRAGLLTAVLLGGVAYLVAQPPDLGLVQEDDGPLVDRCGTRPPRSDTGSVPTVSAPTTSTTSTTSTTVLDPTSTSAAPTTSTPTTSTIPTSVPGDGEPTSTALDSAGAAPDTDDTYWRCTLAENFDGDELDRARWFVQQTAGGDFGVGGECFVDSPNNIAVSDGTLKLTVRQEAVSIPCPRQDNPEFTTPFTAGSIITRQKLDQTYGRYEIRARMPASEVPGLHFAFWLWPRDLTAYPVQFGEGDADHWTNGELDVLEWYSRWTYYQVPYIHYAHTYAQAPDGQWYPNDWNITKACLVGVMSDWHTYTLEWTPTSIRMLYDGNVCLENTHWTPRNTTMPGPFDKPFMVSLTQALGAIGTENQWVPETPLPATAEVDYLKIWE
jgi:beta-glucanase (GH16 family)